MLTTRAISTTDSAARQEPQLAGKRVLIVEDEALVALDLEMTLQAEGARVLGPCGRLAQARRLAASERVDLAILDIMVGREEVFPLARELRARGVPVLFHSGHGDPAELGRDYPDAGFCAKPCAPTAVVAALEALAEG